MTIEQIKYFLTIEELKNFSLAADELCISQSSLSKHIKKLEEELNITLFDRNTRNLKLTAAGEEFKHSCKLILDEYNLLMSKLKKYGVKKDTISLATIPVLNQYGLTSSIAKFIKKHPSFKLNIEEMVHVNILNKLKSGEIDIAFMRSDYLSENEFHINNIASDELVLLVPKNHPLATKKYVSLSDLSKESFILLDENSGIYEICMKSCERAGFTPNILYCHSRIETILGLVGAGVGVTLLMNKTTKCFNNYNISTVLLNNKITSTLSLVTYKNKKISRTCETLKEFLIKSYNFMADY